MELVSRERKHPTCMGMQLLIFTFGGFSEELPIFVDRNYYYN